MRGHRDRAVGTLCLVVERALVNPSVLGVKRRARSLPATTANHAVSCPPCRTRRSASASSTLGTPEPRWSSPTYTCSTSSPTTITNPATVPSISAIVVSGSRCAARLQKDGSVRAGCQLLRNVPDVPVLPPPVPDRRDRRNIFGGRSAQDHFVAGRHGRHPIHTPVGVAGYAAAAAQHRGGGRGGSNGISPSSARLAP